MFVFARIRMSENVSLWLCVLIVGFYRIGRTVYLKVKSSTKDALIATAPTRPLRTLALVWVFRLGVLSSWPVSSLV